MTLRCIALLRPETKIFKEEHLDKIVHYIFDWERK
jgi:hypothetical protein